MKRYLLATAALAALTTQAQVGGPNRPGPGTSPGTFQQPGATESSIKQTSPSSGALSTDRPGDLQNSGPRNTRVGTPDATGGAQSDSLRARRSFPNSRDWETGAVGGSVDAQTGTETSRRLNPPSDGALDPSAAPGSRRIPSDLNTTGVNTPARKNEQPLDKALSAKIRAQLSQTPVGAKPVIKITPESVRDLRITSQNGKVIIEGNVGSKSEKDAIEIRAKEVQGVAAVENRLKVKNENVGSAASGQTGHSSADSKATTSPDASSEKSELSSDK